MRYQSKSSVAYMFRNFGRLFYVTLPMALLLAFAFWLSNPVCEIQVLSQLVNGKLSMDNYLAVLLDNVTVLRYGKFWWVYAIALATLPLCASLTVVKIDRHMRMGLMPALPMKRAFGIYPMMLLYLLCSLAARELCTLVVVGIAAMIKFAGNVTAIISVTLALLLAVHILWVYVTGLLILSFPLKYSENYRFNRAMSYSARIMFPQKRLLWGFATVAPLTRLAVLALAYIADFYGLDAVVWIVYTLAFFFAVTYAPCFAYKHYYDDVGGERRDISRIMFG